MWHYDSWWALRVQMDGQRRVDGWERRGGGGGALDLWHICPSSCSWSNLTHTHTYTFSWLCLATLPACGLPDLPLHCLCFMEWCLCDRASNSQMWHFISMKSETAVFSKIIVWQTMTAPIYWTIILLFVLKCYGVMMTKESNPCLFLPLLDDTHQVPQQHKLDHRVNH